MAKKSGWQSQLKRQMKRVGKGKLACTAVPKKVTAAQVKKAAGAGAGPVQMKNKGRMACVRKGKK